MRSNNNTYGWFKAGIGFGVLAGLTLLVNSVANYQRVSQIVMIDQLRQDLASQVAVLDQQIRSQPEAAARLVTAMQATGRERIAWIQVRNDQGVILAQAGMPAAAVFSPSEFRDRLRQRKPAYRTIDTSRGEVVVEAFPIRMPAAASGVMQPSVFRTIANEASPLPARPALGVVEIAAFTSAVNTVFWPVQRNLLINMTAALALLASLGVMALRFRSYVAGQKLEQDVAVASEVQRDLLSPQRTLPSDFLLAAECRPFAALGGDFYDAFPVEHGVGFVLGDVAGKGVPAALLMGVIHGAVRTSEWTGSARRHIDASARINRLLCEQTASARYASMFWGYFDRRTSELRYVNAGHLAPLVFRAGQAQPLRLEEGGPVLGLLPGASYRQGRVVLEPGDTVVLYTDGAVEASNSADEMFGEERLAHAAQAGDGTPEEIRDRVLAAVNEFAGQQTDGDDRTLVVIRYQGQAVLASQAA